MTVIAHILGRGEMEGVMTAFSDVLLTSDRSTEMKIELPVTHPEHRRKTSCAAIVGARQKMHLFEDKGFIMWAGSYLHARTAISKLQENYEKTGHVDFDWLVDQDHGYDPKEISLIVGASSNGRYFDINSWNSFHRQNELMEVRSSGTGQYFFLDEARDRIAQFHSAGQSKQAKRVDFLTHFFNGVAVSFSNELLDDKFFDTAYGGWYEILLCKERIYKAPYAIKLWQRDNNGFIHQLLTYSSWYSNQDLCIFSGAIEEKEGRQYTKITIIPPTISNHSTKTLEECCSNFQAPEHTVHIMLDKPSGYQVCYIDGTYPQETLRISDGQVLVCDNRTRVVPKLIEYYNALNL